MVTSWGEKRKNDNNIRNIKTRFVSCEVDYIFIFPSGKLLALHIKKKYRLLYMQFLRGIFPTQSKTLCLSLTCLKGEDIQYLVFSKCGLYMILSCIIKTLQDNNPKHPSKSTTEWRQRHILCFLEWPSQSSDLNTIEKLWSDLGWTVFVAKVNLHKASVYRWIHIIG